MPGSDVAGSVQKRVGLLRCSFNLDSDQRASHAHLHQLTKHKQQDFDIFRARGWLASQPDALIDWMMQAGRWKTYEAHEVLYHADEDPDALYGLASGGLEITLPLVGTEPVTIHRAEPGFWLGDAAILSQSTRMVGVAAVAKSVVYRVPAAALQALVREKPEFWPCFYGLTFMNTKLSLTLLAEVMSLSPRARVARMLLRMADDKGEVQVSQNDLARLIGMNRSSLQRALHDLLESRVLTSGYRSLRINERQRLVDVSDEA